MAENADNCDPRTVIMRRVPFNEQHMGVSNTSYGGGAMTDLELRQLDARVHEAFFGVQVEWTPYYHLPNGEQIALSWDVPTYLGDTESARRFGLRYLVSRYTTDFAAAWTLDRPEWRWKFYEGVFGERVQATIYGVNGMDPLAYGDARIENGDKSRAYCLARVKCVLRALKAKRCR